MVPKPESIGLWICERVIVEAESGSITLVASHSRKRYGGFPADADPFSVFAMLTGGHGTGRIELRILDVAEAEMIETRDAPIRFADPASELRLHIRLRGLRFHHSGVFSFGLFIDDEFVAERQLRVFA